MQRHLLEEVQRRISHSMYNGASLSASPSALLVALPHLSQVMAC
jgi:hypothetical protein